MQEYIKYVIITQYDWFQKYKNADIDVERKDGLILIRELAAEVKNMMDFKMSAVMVCYLWITLIWSY